MRALRISASQILPHCFSRTRARPRPPDCAPALAGLRSGGWLVAPALVVAEMAEEEDLPSTDGYAMLDDRVYGDTRVVILRNAPHPLRADAPRTLSHKGRGVDERGLQGAARVRAR